jgi:hypothetical protein
MSLSPGINVHVTPRTTPTTPQSSPTSSPFYSNKDSFAFVGEGFIIYPKKVEDEEKERQAKKVTDAAKKVLVVNQ